MELEETKKVLEAYINAIDTFGTIDYKCINNLYNPVKTVLQALENSIPKEVIEKKIEVLEKLQNEFKDNEEIRIKIITYKELLEGK